MILLLIKGILLGLGAAAPIGPVNVEIARRSLRTGFGSGAAIGFGAVTVDVYYALLTGIGLRLLVEQSWFYQPMRYASIALLVFLAFMCFVGAARAMRTDLIEAQPPRRSVSSGYVTGLLMTLVNPMTLAFWFVAVPGTLGHIAGNPRTDLPIICIGVALGTGLWVVFFAGVMGALGKRYRRRWWLVAADVVGGIMLLGFAGWTFFHQPQPYNAPQTSREALGAQRQ